MTEINNLGAEILNQLQRWTNLVEEDFEKAKTDTAKELVEDLKRHSPEGKRKKYHKGWSIKKQGNKLVVWNKTDYQLTHLLEHGHAKRGGGRTRAFPHIAPNEEKAIRAFLERTERAIRQ